MFNLIKARIFGTAQEAEAIISEAVARTVERVMREQADRVDEELGALSTIRDLRQQIAQAEDQLRDLKIRSQEKDREIQHKLGLHKKQVEHDKALANSKQQATEDRLEKDHAVSVREAKVAAREEAMAEAQKQMRESLARAEKMVDILVEALPKAEIMANLTNKNDG